VTASNAIDLTNTGNLINWLAMGQGGKTVGALETQVLQDCITAASAYWIWSLGLSPNLGVAPVASPLNSILSYSETYDGSGSDRMFLRIRPIVSVSALTVDGIPIPASTGVPVPGFVIDNTGKSLAIISGFGGPGPGQRLTVGFSFLCGGNFWTFRAGLQNVQVQYTAGYAPQSISNELQTIPATSPWTIGVNLQPWFTDLGVKYYVGGAPLTAVSGAPSAGQYNLQPGGQYVFAAADAGKQVQISYTATGVPYDVEMAMRQMVAVNYKRRSWIDQRMQSMAQGAGSISYRDWELPPDVCSVMARYRRRGVA
jgi:hypothetical protein